MNPREIMFEWFSGTATGQKLIQESKGREGS